MNTFMAYQSPFSWRYGSAEMRRIWGEENKRLLWRRLWVALAETQTEFHLVTSEQLEDLKKQMLRVDIAHALEIEKEIHHDLMAELKVFAGQCPLGGGILHMGATSMDIKDNAEVLQIKQSLDILLKKLKDLLKKMVDKMEEHAGTTIMAFTHLQPAEPTTLGYRLAGTAQDLFADYETLAKIHAELKGKGFKGAVGNAASYGMLVGTKNLHRFEMRLSQTLGLPFFEIASQTYPRRQDYILLSALASLAAACYKFAFDLRLLQSEVVGELAEPFGGRQVGSSAMPFKRNPVDAEKICSLARALGSAPLTAWNNQANSLLERTLDDSANRRSLIPETFLSMDEILTTLTGIIAELHVNRNAIRQNLEKFGPFAAVERVLMAAVKNGGNRQGLHERLRKLSMAAWQAVQQDQVNPLVSMVAQDESINCFIDPNELKSLFDVERYTGFAEKQTLEMVQQIRGRFH